MQAAVAIISVSRSIHHKLSFHCHVMYIFPKYFMYVCIYFQNKGIRIRIRIRIRIQYRNETLEPKTQAVIDLTDINSEHVLFLTVSRTVLDSLAGHGEHNTGVNYTSY